MRLPVCALCVAIILLGAGDIAAQPAPTGPAAAAAAAAAAGGDRLAGWKLLGPDGASSNEEALAQLLAAFYSMAASGGCAEGMQPASPLAGRGAHAHHNLPAQSWCQACPNPFG